MYKNVLQSIAGVDIYPIISLVIFVSFFVGMLIYVIRVPKKLVSHMSSLPLDSTNNEME